MSDEQVMETIEKELYCLNYEFEMGIVTEEEYATLHHKITMSGEWLMFVAHLPETTTGSENDS